MNHEFLRMQKLSGVITEGEYNQKIEELNSAESSTETLNENVVGIGSVLNPYPAKKEEAYESAFNKFLTEEKEEVTEETVNEEEVTEETVNEDERTDAEEEGYQDGFKDALKDVKDALAKLRKELKEVDLTEEETEKEKEEGDMRDDGGEDAETRETEDMKDMGRD